MELDIDLEAMNASTLAEEVRRLRAAIREHRDSSGMALCWYHPQLWGLLPESAQAPIAVPEWPQFLRGCVRFRQSLDDERPDAPRTTEEYDPRDEGE